MKVGEKKRRVGEGRKKCVRIAIELVGKFSYTFIIMQNTEKRML